MVPTTARPGPTFGQALMIPPSRAGRRWSLAALVTLCVLLGACASPVRGVRVDRSEAHRDLTQSAVTTNSLSWPSRDVLLERGVLDVFHDRPEEAIAYLHGVMLAENGDPDLIFALAETSYLHGEASGQTEYQLAAAVYAYAYLFPEDGAARPGPFDPRLRTAADLYNWSLTAVFTAADGTVVPRADRFALPFGEITVAFDPADMRAGNRELFDLVPLAEYEVEGLVARYRRPGIGAPLAASSRPIAGAPAGTDMVAPRVKVPLTALLRIPEPRRALIEQRPLSADLELHLDWDKDSVEIAGESVALESEPTAALALTFTGIPVMEIEVFGFLGRLTGKAAERPPLVSVSPYRPGVIPVVFVHGTASSPVRWANLYNRLQADKEINSRFQFWFFQYESDNPIALSSLRLREALSNAVNKLDPEGRDPALREMVLIGHSQGGLLVKMQTVDTGDRLWNAISNKPIDEMRLSDETRDLIKRGMFVEPVPEVSRVIFMATPHRGSFLASSRFVLSLVRSLTTLPLQIVGAAAELARNPDALKHPLVPTAVDNMSPRHPFILALQEIPVTPSVEAHSIIAVKAGADPIETGNDGVVEYTSAHIADVASELVVRSPHSCQAHPDALEEVRRILRLHAGIGPGVGPDPESGSESQAPTEAAPTPQVD